MARKSIFIQKRPQIVHVDVLLLALSGQLPKPNGCLGFDEALLHPRVETLRGMEEGKIFQFLNELVGENPKTGLLVTVCRRTIVILEVARDASPDILTVKSREILRHLADTGFEPKKFRGWRMYES